ncbi:hypothetical protein LOAG_11230 [Loa loa]|uniref:Uncharacterized protein n=1 Tax=Loa loa TaxID=7209 RepID=A0A1S0TN92_LOALO|nr:hypothetical protein LOAG_11230 [Loa loa]EFO17271.1 hypothetical protein LOAG_11230 [Loa loa]
MGNQGEINSPRQLDNNERSNETQDNQQELNKMIIVIYALLKKKKKTRALKILAVGNVTGIWSISAYFFALSLLVVVTDTKNTTALECGNVKSHQELLMTKVKEGDVYNKQKRKNKNPVIPSDWMYIIIE